MLIKSIITVTFLAVILLGFSFNQSENNKESKAKGRWYTQSQLNLGKQVFKENCASCHGQNAEKTKIWKKTLPDGSYPPPPLNGTAHAWHHPMKTLLATIDNGGSPYGGKMPAFKDKLTHEKKLAAIAYFQSFWIKEIYESWNNRGKQ